MTDLEMARLLAEKIMGWEPLEGDSTGTTYKRWASAKKDTFYMETIGSTWQPLRFITHAWEIRDKLAEKGSVSVFWSYVEKLNQCTVLFFDELPDGTTSITRADPSPARAICLAALRAVGVEV